MFISSAFAQTAPAAAAGGGDMQSSLMSMLPLVLMFVVLYFVMSRPQMKKQKSGRIINLASTLGVVGLANRTPYATSKGAVVLMTRALALELAPFHITVNAICPGPFLTDMNIPIKDDENTKKFIVGAVALERWGELQEIQGAAIYLASAASSYTTGSLITVDGGWTAR